MAEQSAIYVIAGRLVEGLAGVDAGMSDYSPEGAEAVRDLGRATRAKLETAPTATSPGGRRWKPSMRRPVTHRRIGQNSSRRFAKIHSDPPASPERGLSGIVAP